MPTENQLPSFNFVVNTSVDAVKESSGGFIGKSGVYPVVINFVSVEQTANGAYRFNINLSYNGNSQVIYGANIQNNNGEANAIGARLLNKLCKIAGLDTGARLTFEEEEHTVGKDNEVRTFVVATELSGLECQIQVKEVFDKYKGEIKRKIDPINFFSLEGATADELAAKDAGQTVTLGAQLAKILEAESTTQHKLGKDENDRAVTEEEVVAFLNNKKPGSTKPAATAGVTPKVNIFAAK